MIYNTTVTDAASEILRNERHRTKSWVIREVLDLCEERRDLKKKRYEAKCPKRIQGSRQEESKGSEENKRGLMSGD